MSSPFIVIIPARYGSTRLPGKALLDIAGKPLIQHVYESACGSQAREVIVATDDDRIMEAAAGFGARAVLTSCEHQSGTDRIAEVLEILGADDEMIVVNAQGDEFGLPPAIIDQVADALSGHEAAVMATLCERIIDMEEYHDPNAVKVVSDRFNMAMMFSRRPLPWYEYREGDTPADFPCQPRRHIGIYAYRAGFLRVFPGLPPCPLERSERLEQLRVLYNGYKIHVEEACARCGVGVDTRSDLEFARKLAITS